MVRFLGPRRFHNSLVTVNGRIDEVLATNVSEGCPAIGVWWVWLLYFPDCDFNALARKISKFRK